MRSNPEAVLLGNSKGVRDGQRLHLHRHRPEPVAGDREHAARLAERRRVEHPPARCRQVAHPVVLHAQEAHLAGRAEAVLDAAEHAVLAEALALEVEDHVDHVLEGARPRDRSLLGDVPDEQHGHPGALGRRRSCAGPRLELGRRSRVGPACRRRGASGRSRSPPARGALLRSWRSRCRRRTPTSRRTLAPVHPSRRARRASCSSDSSPVQYSAGDTSSPQLFDTCSAMVDFPMPGSPPSSTTLPGTIPPPRTRSISQDPVGCTRGPTAITAVQGRGDRSGGTARRPTAGDANNVLAQAVPGLTRRAAPLPLRRLGPALATHVVQAGRGALQVGGHGRRILPNRCTPRQALIAGRSVLPASGPSSAKEVSGARLSRHVVSVRRQLCLVPVTGADGFGNRTRGEATQRPRLPARALVCHGEEGLRRSQPSQPPRSFGFHQAITSPDHHTPDQTTALARVHRS